MSITWFEFSHEAKQALSLERKERELLYSREIQSKVNDVLDTLRPPQIKDGIKLFLKLEDRAKRFIVYAAEKAMKEYFERVVLSFEPEIGFALNKLILRLTKENEEYEKWRLVHQELRSKKIEFPSSFTHKEMEEKFANTIKENEMIIQWIKDKITVK